MSRSLSAPQFYGRQIVTLITPLTIVLVRIPTLVGDQTFVAPAVLLILLLCVTWGVPRHHMLRSRTALAVVLVYVGWMAITVVRGSQAGVYVKLSHAISDSLTYFAVVAFGLLLVTTSRSKAERRRRLVAIALAPGVYSLANALLQLGGVRAANQDPSSQGIATFENASLLKLVHIYAHRVQFPLASGVNSSGIVSGAGLAACLILIMRRAAPPWLTWPCLAGCIYNLVLGDNRTSLGLGIGAAVYFAWTRRMTTARLLPILVPVLPLLAILVTALLNGPLGGVLSRGSNDDFATVNHRTFIWEAAWHMLRSPGLQDLYGWGALGQVTSGLSQHYAYLFGSLPHPYAYSTHDIVIQTVVDSGYIGLALLVAAVGVTTYRLIASWLREADPVVRALMAVLVVTILGGTTEALPNYGSEEALVAMLLVMGAAAGFSRPGPNPTKSKASRAGIETHAAARRMHLSA